MRCKLWSLLLLMFVLILSGCEKVQPPLRVGTNLWPGYEPLFLARSLGFYEGASIRLINFSSASDAMRAYRHGAIDVGAFTADEALQVAEFLPDQRIVLVCDFSAGGDVIMARPRFRNMAELRGRRIGVEQTALGAYMLARALDISGMSVQDVIVTPVPLEEHEKAYASGRVDAVVTFEPSRSHLLAAGARQVFDSSQIPGEIVDVLLVRPECIDASRGAIAILIDGWFQALDYLRRKPQDAARRVAPRQRLTEEEFLKSLEGLRFPDRAENIRRLGRSEGNMDEKLKKLQEIMLENRLLSRFGALPVKLDDRFVLKGAK